MVAGHNRDEIVVCPPYTGCCGGNRGGARDRMSRSAGRMFTGKRKGRSRERFPLPCCCALGVTHVIIGHSERRQYFGETDDTVNLRLKTALEAGLIPICCVGEVLEEREAGLTDDVLRRQCVRAFHAISAKKAAKLIVAYEPVWAIGTGQDGDAGTRGRGSRSDPREATEDFW